MQLTSLIQRMGEGDESARNDLFEAVYDDLHRRAQQYMRRQPRDHTLWVTDVVHGAYARMCGKDTMRWNDRNHFFATAALAMEHLLVEHARSKGTLKRAPRGRREPLDDLQADYEASIPERAANVLDVHDALKVLASFAPRAAAVVRLRIFAQLSVDRIATTMGVPKRTVERDWAFALRWLRNWLRGDGRRS